MVVRKVEIVGEETPAQIGGDTRFMTYLLRRKVF